MPYAFVLPTTSNISFSTFFRSDSHPSLLLAATTHRNVVRNVLKKHKRLGVSEKTSNLSNVLTALNEYLPFLLALEAGLSGRRVAGEEVYLVLIKEIEVEWRASLTMTFPGKEAPRIRGIGLDYEICFVLTTLAYTHNLLARVKLNELVTATISDAERKSTIVTAAVWQMLQANSIHDHIIHRTSEVHSHAAAVDVSMSVQSGLASLALAEATLLAVLKDDPYPTIVAQSRNEDDREWMIKPPDIPKVRAHLFARLSLAAAEHAGSAFAQLSNLAGGRGELIDKPLHDYIRDLQGTSRAKACRFFGIDAELGGKTGEAIAWMTAGKKALRFKVGEGDGAKVKGLAKLKQNWAERREDKELKKGADWGSDAGRLEEARVLEMLETKWRKTNDLVSTPFLHSQMQNTEHYKDKLSTNTSLRISSRRTAIRKRNPHAKKISNTQP